VRIEKKDALQKERAKGKGARRASTRDFHSFRVTWITLALAAGVPLELVQRVTAHKTVDVVLKHYFRPGREDFKQRILAAMPQLLTGVPDSNVIDVVAEEKIPYQTSHEPGPSEKLAEARAILEKVTGKANQERVAEAVALIEAAKGWLDGHLMRERS
jgi:hypothetical protein